MKITKKISIILKSTIYGFVGMASLLIVYFLAISLISGWPFVLNQFSQFWYFLISLAERNGQKNARPGAKSIKVVI